MDRKKRILIVDDEKNILQMLKNALHSDNIEWTTTQTMQETEAVLETTIFDVVLLDIRLTGVKNREGIEILTKIKDISPDTQVIVMTGYGSFDIEQEVYDLGAYYYYDKLVDLNTLIDNLTELGIYSEEEAGNLRIEW